MQQMPVIIRKSTEKDIPSIYALIKAFAFFQKTPGKVLVTQEQMKADKDLFQCFVAEDTTISEIVGFASFFYAYYSWSGKALCLDDLYVKDNFRKQNIGTALMNAVIAFARENNCKKLRWQVSNWNINAQTFYKKLGAVIDDTEINCDLIF